VASGVISGPKSVASSAGSPYHEGRGRLGKHVSEAIVD